MVTDQQVRLLMELPATGKTFQLAAAKSGMDLKTARKYRRLGRLLALDRTIVKLQDRLFAYAEKKETQLARSSRRTY